MSPSSEFQSSGIFIATRSDSPFLSVLHKEHSSTRSLDY